MVSSINYLATMVYVYLIIYITVLVYPEAIGTQAEETSYYTPKSRRWFVVEYSKQVCHKLTKRFMNKMDQWLADTTPRRRGTTMQNRVLRQRRTSISFKTVGLVAFLALVMTTEAKAIQSQRVTTFDTDSGKIGIDNRCTACI